MNLKLLYRFYIRPKSEVQTMMVLTQTVTYYMMQLYLGGCKLDYGLKAMAEALILNYRSMVLIKMIVAYSNIASTQNVNR